MKLFDKLFKNFKSRPQMYCGYKASSTQYNKNLYEQETVRAIIDCIATHAAKAQAMHIVLNESGRIKEVKRNSPYVKLLNSKPNSLMSGYDFKYKLITQLQARNTALAYIKWDGITPIAFIPIDYTHFDVYTISGGGYAIKFTDSEGNLYTLDLEDVICLRKFYNTRDISGDSNQCIYNTLDMVKASDEGFVEALSIANKVRGVHKQKKAMLDREDVEKSQKEFSARFEKAAREGGIVSIDSMEEYIPLNINTFTANSDQMKTVRDNLFTYWRTSESIVKSDYTEQQGMAWYESVIEPLWEMMSQAFTNACFTQREKDVGNRIVFTGGVLTGTAYQTRINIIDKAKETGLLTINEQRELLGYAPIEGGDIRQISLNYVNADNQNKYQGVD